LFCIFAAHSIIQKYIIMGRGDKKTKRGKISKGSFGKSRPAKKNRKKKEEKKEEK